MEIESMVANSALVRAREGGGVKGRSDKWKDMLRFPHISQCMDVAVSLEREYWSLCVKQPIGKQLFQLFCRSQPSLQNYVSLQDALDAFEAKSDNERAAFGIGIVHRFFRTQSNQCVPVMVPHELHCLQSLEQDPCADVFLHCRRDLHQQLSGEPFLQYQESMFFDRFLQWKMLERQPVTKQSFRQYRLLGKGGFGEVWACQVRATGMMYACKKLEKTHVKKRKGETMALNEKELLESLDSRFVVSLAYAYETKHDLCMVLTMMSGGDLRFHIYSIGTPGLDKDRVRFYAAEVCCGLMHLHHKSIVYRDLKPENILLDDKGHIRISDLGLAVRLQDGCLVHGRGGTLGYMAPEVIGHKQYGTSADWWGLGCLIYEMTAGQPVLRSRGEHPVPAEMERRIQVEQVDYGKQFSLDVRDLCSRLLNKDPHRRLGCGSAGGTAVQSHRFFKKINFRMLEAGLVEPPFTPDPKQVYCNDVQDIEEFSSVKGITLDQTDFNFYAQFNTGSVPITWQNELIETGCFRELNIFGPKGSRPADLDWTQVPEKRSPKSLLDRIFRRHHSSPEAPDEELLLPDHTYLGAGLIGSTL
ncbi:G protein-coupled receptor kinase 5 isoform X1 [Synchiropus splendidus]|uniref:G protein-coupled receptor kinase 5 isoform X1 n=1 Tax=Synchiropus splendidus TaxID=270530 RepID=UPI00237D7BAD|nr:G protein-coupled receptor kinase 5 isoform X1 [Synchiropus splendidus]